MYKKSALFVKMGGQRRMGGEGISNITDALIVQNNFRTKEDHKSFQEKFGKITFGKDKQQINWPRHMAKAINGSEKQLTILKSASDTA